MSTPEVPDEPTDTGTGAGSAHVPPLTTRVVIAEDEALIRLDLKEMLEEEAIPSSGRPGTVSGPSSWRGSCARIWSFSM